MTQKAGVTEPADANERRAASPVICYEGHAFGLPETDWLAQWQSSLQCVEQVRVPPRDARAFQVPAGHGFRIISIEGPQVGDLNLWNAHDMSERFYSGKTRQLQATHLTRGDHLWSSMPHLRPMACITHDSLEWYGWDADGAGIHDVIGTRCDPWTNHQLRGEHYHRCCHSNLVRALVDETGLSFAEAETHVHDVLNVFMCTGFTAETHQYFMKASPVRPGDSIEFLAQIDLMCALSTCPGGDCSRKHSDDSTDCHPLLVEILRPDARLLESWTSIQPSGYDGSHGR